MRPIRAQSSSSAAGSPGTAQEAGPIEYGTSSSPNGTSTSESVPCPEGTAANPSRFLTDDPSKTIAWQPERRPLITVSATAEASAIATIASPAVPPSAKISAPASAVVACPAATPTRMPRSAGDLAGRRSGATRGDSSEVAQRPVDEEDAPEDRGVGDGAELPAVREPLPAQQAPHVGPAVPVAGPDEEALHGHR